MRETVGVEINGRAVEVRAGTSVAAALLMVGEAARISVSGEARGALCGMGICFECRAVVNGRAQQRTCQMVCEDGMTVETNR